MTRQEWLDYSVEQDFWKSVYQFRKPNRLNTSRRDSDERDLTVLAQAYEAQLGA